MVDVWEATSIREAKVKNQGPIRIDRECHRLASGQKSLLASLICKMILKERIKVTKHLTI